MKKIILGLVFILSFISVKSQITTAQMLQNINDTVYQNTAHAITGTKLNKLLRTLVTYINGQSSGNIDTLSLVHKSYSITETITGNKTFSGNTVLSGNVTLTPTINSSLTGTNQRVPSHTTAYIVFTNASLTSIGSANNGGVTGGHTFCIANETGASITLVNNYASAAAGEAIYTGRGSDVIIPNHGSFWLQYNATASAWESISSGSIPLATGVTGVLPVANGGTNASSASITAFNNITGYSAAGATGTTSTNLVFSTSPTLTTPVLGVASSTSETITGTGGNGFLELATQSSNPSAPSSGTRLFSNSNSKFSWRGSANNYVKTFDGSAATADRVYSLPDKSMTVAGVDDVYIPIYCLYGGQIALTDGTTSYFSITNIAPSSTAANQDFNLGYAVTLIAATITVGGNTTAGSNENVTLNLRNTTQATSSLIGLFQTDGGSTTNCSAFTFTGLNISVASSDSWALEVVNPTWGTNPVGANYRVLLTFKRTN